VSVASYLRGLLGGDAARVAEALRQVDAPPAKAGDLLKEQARPSMGSVLTVTRKSQADHLTPARLASIMREADAGNVEAYLTLAEEMEEREPHYRSVIGTRKMAVSGAPIQVTAASESAHDKAIAEHVTQIMQSPNIEGLVLDLMDAVSKSFSCVEILWDRDGKLWEPVSYEWRDAKHFVFDKDTMRTPLLRADGAPEGVPLMPYKWLVHMPKLGSGVPIRTGLARPVAVCYSAKRYTVSDWLTFMDVYGMPIRVGKFPASQASKKAELLRAVRSIGTDAAAVIPAEMSIEFIESKGGAGGTTLFQQSAEYWDKQTSKVVLGQTMSSDDGSSLAQSKTHERVRFDIKKADGRAVQATINRDLIKPFVLLNYGPQQAYPTCALETQEPEDRKILMEATKTYVDMGGEVDATEIRELMGFSEPAAGAKLLKPAQVVVAEMTPEPEPAPEPAPSGGKPGKGGKTPAKEGDEIADDAGGSAEANAAISALGERFDSVEAHLMRLVQMFDVVDDQSRDALSDWRELTGPVFDAMKRIEESDTFEEAQSVIDALKKDEGEALDISPLVAALARRTFTVRGVGDATDDPEV